MRGRWMQRSLRTACLALALARWLPAGADEAGAAAGSFRGAQETGLNLSLRPVDLLNLAPGSAPPGSFRAAQEIGGDAWSRRYGDRWSAQGYQGPGAPPPWAGGKDQPLGSGAARF
jgi:hypothetical protein